jgi:hypothetical protein
MRLRPMKVTVSGGEVIVTVPDARERPDPEAGAERAHPSPLP